MDVTRASTLELPCGAVLPNRISKAAMTEGLATPDGRPTPALERLYGIWSDGGAGMLLSGNIIVDRDHLERPGNVVIETEPDADMKARLADWAKAARGVQAAMALREASAVGFGGGSSSAGVARLVHMVHAARAAG